MARNQFARAAYGVLCVDHNLGSSGDGAVLVGRRAADDGTGIGALASCATFEEFKQEAERAFLLAKLRAFDWNVSETARALDMPRSNLYKKIERYALTREG